MAGTRGPSSLAAPLARGAHALENTETDRSAQAENVLPKRIIEMGYAFWRSKALLSAVELDVFTVLAIGPLDLQTVRARIGIHERGARDFFDALVALGLLYRDAEGRYGNQPDTDLYLDRHKRTYIGVCWST